MGRTDARGWASLILDWGVEPQGWQRTRPKRARARERYETVVTMKHEPSTQKARTRMTLVFFIILCSSL